MEPFHKEYLYGASDDWFMVCRVCGERLFEGTEAWVQDDEQGNGLNARCFKHGNPNAYVSDTEINKAVAELQEWISVYPVHSSERPVT